MGILQQRLRAAVADAVAGGAGGRAVAAADAGAVAPPLTVVKWPLKVADILKNPPSGANASSKMSTTGFRVEHLSDNCRLRWALYGPAHPEHANCVWMFFGWEEGKFENMPHESVDIIYRMSCTAGKSEFGKVVGPVKNFNVTAAATDMGGAGVSIPRAVFKKATDVTFTLDILTVTRVLK